MNRGDRQGPDEVERRGQQMIHREHVRRRAAERAALAREEAVRLEAARREAVHEDAARREHAAGQLEDILREVVAVRGGVPIGQPARGEAAGGEAARGEEAVGGAARGNPAAGDDAAAENYWGQAVLRETARREGANAIPARDVGGEEGLAAILRGVIGIRGGARRGEAARGEANRGEEARGNRDRGDNARREAVRAEDVRGEAARPRGGPRAIAGEAERRNARRAAAAMMARGLEEHVNSDEEEVPPERNERVAVVREMVEPIIGRNGPNGRRRGPRQRFDRLRNRIPDGLRRAQLGLNLEPEELQEQQRQIHQLLIWQENREDQDAEAHPNFLRRNRERNRAARAPRIIRDNQYYLAAAREVDYNQLCPFCKESFKNKIYLTHLDACPRAMDDYRDKLAEVHLFNSGVHVFHRDLFKLREACELSYFDAILDPSKMIDMMCVLCTTHTEHAAGGCLRNHMRAVFMKKAKDIGNRILAHYEQNLELIKQKAIDELLVKHGDYFESVEAFLTDEPADLDTEHQRQAAWFDFKQRSASQTVERTRLIDKESEKSQALFLTKKTEVQRTIDSFCNSMCQYINDNKLNERLPQIVNNRKAHPLFQEPANEQEQPTGELDGANALVLNNFMENYIRERAEENAELERAANARA
ncbi:hypothetical protein CAEBREN_32796 [Caenorhabditis brenneri]|uniref:Uncharacterized protein n=1 Tax=Caenorhabditis brenneri TaxID=135651 RepID=G0N1T5_CAEBE|nr:hypothetical protein CAEBREN_32796 [Caenorhabditis brenneri]